MSRSQGWDRATPGLHRENLDQACLAGANNVASGTDSVSGSVTTTADNVVVIAAHGLLGSNV